MDVIHGRGLEELAGILCSELGRPVQGSARRPEDPFRPVTILVPNAPVKQWLLQQIAQQNGIAANLDIRFFEGGLWHCLAGLEAAQGEDPGDHRIRPPAAARAILLTREILQAMIMGTLLAEPTDRAADAALAPIRRYIIRSGDSTPETTQRMQPENPEQARRLWDLSDQLARLFREYEYHRGDLVSCWLAGRQVQKLPLSAREMEACQRALYRSLFARGGLRDRLAEKSGRSYLSLPHYFHRIMEQVPPSPPETWEVRTVRVFGLSQFARFHVDLIKALAPFYRWRLYYPRLVPWDWPGEPSPLNAEEGTAGRELTHPWTRRARDTNQLMGDLAVQGRNAPPPPAPSPAGHGDSAREPRPADGGPSPLLKTLQHHIQTPVSPWDTTPVCRQDLSLQVAGCPGIYREVETVYNSIVHNMHRDERLKLTDIALFVTDMARYKPVLESVFGREPRNLAFNLADSSALEDSVYADAVLGLLDLAEGGFSRREVFELMLNPCFLARGNITRDDVTAWLRWTSALNIYRSFDETEKYRGINLPEDERDARHTWSLGLRRLRLGRIMETPEERAEAGSFSDYHGVVPYAGMDTDAASVGLFSELVEQLHERAGLLRTGEENGRAWGTLLCETLDLFLGIPPDRRAEATVRSRLFQALGSHEPDGEPSILELFQNILFAVLPSGEGTAPPETVRLTLPLVRHFVQAGLGQIQARKGSLLADGVTVLPLHPERGVPFKIVYVLGLGEGEFPGRERPSTLDLRQHLGRGCGDVSPPDLKRHAFLETLLATREKLYLTFVSRDLQKDQPFFPCSLVNQLKAAVEQGLFGSAADAPAFEFFEMPLKGSSPVLVLDRGQEKAGDKTDLFEGVTSAMDAVVCYDQLSKEGLLTGREDRMAQVNAACDAARPAFSVSDPCGQENQAETAVVTLRELAGFLQNPVEAALARHMGLYRDREEDHALEEDEPLATGYPFDFMLLQGVLADLVPRGSGGSDPELEELAGEIFDRHYRGHHLQGATPEGVFEHRDRAHYRNRLQALMHPEEPKAESLAEFLGRVDRDGYLQNVIIGEATSGVPSDTLFPAPVFALEQGREDAAAAAPGRTRLQVRLHADLPYFWRAEAGGTLPQLLVLAPTAGGPVRDGGRPTKHLLPPLLFYLTALAGEASNQLFSETGVRINILYKQGLFWWTYGPLSREAASDYLQQLLRDYLEPNVFDLLPFDLVRRVGGVRWDGANWVPFLDEGRGPVPARVRQEYTRALEREEAKERRNPMASYKPPAVLDLVRPTVPMDAYEKVRDRLGLLFRFTDSSLAAKKKGAGSRPSRGKGKKK